MLIHRSIPGNLRIECLIEGLEAPAVVSIPEYHGHNHYQLFKDLRDSRQYPFFKHLFLIGPEGKIPNDAISINRIIQNRLSIGRLLISIERR